MKVINEIGDRNSKWDWIFDGLTVYVSKEWNEIVSESISWNVQWAAKMICAMKVSTQVKSTLSKNHPWSMKATTKIKMLRRDVATAMKATM